MRTLDHFENYLQHASVRHAQPSRRGMRQVDDPGFHIRPAIIHSDNDALVAVKTADSHPGAKRQCAMRSGQLLFVVNLAAGCFLPMVRLAIPTCEALLEGLLNQWSLGGCAGRKTIETKQWEEDSQHLL